MINQKLRKKIAAYAEDEGQEITLLDDPSFDNSIIGISTNGKLIYDYNKMIEELSADDNINLLESEEFIQYNTIRALPYFENAPIIMIAPREEVLLYEE